MDAVVDPAGVVDNWNADASVPESEIDCGEFTASSVIMSEAVRLPSALGVNFTVASQCDCNAIAAARQVFVCEKSVGFDALNVIPETCSTAVPELLN